MSSSDEYSYYWLGTRALGFWPATTATMRIYYLRLPRRFNLANRTVNKATSENPLDDDDELTVPKPQQNLLQDYTLWRAFERVGLHEQAVVHRNQYTFGRREKKEKDQDPQSDQNKSQGQKGLWFGSKKGI